MVLIARCASAYAEWVRTRVIAALLAVVAALGVAVAAAITTVGASEPPPVPQWVVDVSPSQGLDPSGPTPSYSAGDHGDDDHGDDDQGDDDHGGEDDDD